MQELTGKPIMEQIVAGQAVLLPAPHPLPSALHPEQLASGVHPLPPGPAGRHRGTGLLLHQGPGTGGEAVASIFNIHSLLLEDRDYVETVRRLIQGRGVTAEYAVQMTELSFSSAFSAMDSSYMRARAADIRDISQRVIRALMGDRQELTMEAPAILVSDDFLPSEVMDFDQNRLLGLITRKGSLDSHTAMLIRAFHIPSMVEVNLAPKWEGHLALMDGYAGKIYLDPEQAQQDKLREMYQANGCPVEYASI